MEIDATLREAYDAVIDVLPRLYPASHKCQTSVIMARFQQQLYEIMTSCGKVMIRVTPFFAILNRTGFRWLILCGLLLVVVFIPFVLMAESISIWTDGFASDVLHPKLTRMADGQDRARQAAFGDAVMALVLGTLLASDVLLPIPSSLLSTAAGSCYGFWPGTLLSVVGMTISCAFGYWVGASAGRHAAFRLVGNRELARLEEMNQRCGDWMIVVARSIPVLAEASTFFAGISRMPRRRFALLSVCSNLGISLVYAAIGVHAVHINSFMWAFAGAILVPAIVLLIWSNTKRYLRVID